MKILISAGDAITAKLIENAGFDGIWVSGFEASARLGLADNGSITMTEMLYISKPIVDATRLPVYVDVDTGYGNFQRTVREFEGIGVKGLCMEDNMPKKENSLWGGKVPLVSIDDYCKKIKSVKKRNLKIVARTEALIRDYGMGEAVKRAKAYKKAGADFILIHTRDKEGKQAGMIPEFCRDVKAPLVIVPTKFPHFTNKKLEDLGYSIVIWANQTERVKIKAIRKALDKIKTDDCAQGVEAKFSATLDDMKGLMPND